MLGGSQDEFQVETAQRHQVALGLHFYVLQIAHYLLGGVALGFYEQCTPTGKALHKD